ncbi:transmembrane protein 272-like isoform X2 [Convolutriloba macropyga]|uniref:transmembrane protein 272-like isoform X2 n=1 Tax=Convolutriloba macropyga TaxID=536237 RepID=UPI003F52222E
MAESSGTKYELAQRDEEAGSALQDPPNYQSGSDSKDGAPAEPPSYNSLFGELKAAKADSGGANMDFFKKIVAILMGSIATTIILALFLAFPIAMIVIGALKLDDCPAEEFIPKWLLIMGCFGLLKNLMSLGQQVFNKAKDNNDKNASKNPIECILDLFLFAWFIAGSVWVYRTYETVSWKTPPSSPEYCDELLFQFSFWSLTLVYLFIALSCLLCMFGACCVAALS